MDSATDLIQKLGNSDDYFERQKAAWALVALGSDAIDALVDALENGEFSDLRYKSAWALGKIRDPRAVEPLARAMLGDPDYVVREWCAAALETLGDMGAVPFLVKAAGSDSQRDVRLRAVTALRELSASDELIGLLGHVDPDVRSMALTALARLRHSPALDHVAPLMEHDDSEVRRRAVAFMGELGGETVLDFLAKALKDQSPDVREQALKSLGKIPGQSSCQIAISALKDEEPRIRQAASTALGEIGHGYALDALIELMLGDDYEEIRAWAAWSLGEIGDSRAVDPLKEACRSSSPSVQKKASDSLREVFKLEP